MAANNELQTTRLDGTIHSGPDVTVAFQTVEASLRNILGATADSALSAIISMATGPNVTFQGAVTLAGAPTADLHCSTRAYADAQVEQMFSRYYCGRYTQSVNHNTNVSIDWANLGDHKDSSWGIYSSGRLVPPEEGVYFVAISATINGTSTGTLKPIIADYGDGTTIAAKRGLISGGQRSSHVTRSLSFSSPSTSSCIWGLIYQTTGAVADVDISAVVLRVGST